MLKLILLDIGWCGMGWNGLTRGGTSGGQF
jgi:hypothetical protein